MVVRFQPAKAIKDGPDLRLNPLEFLPPGLQRLQGGAGTGDELLLKLAAAAVVKDFDESSHSLLRNPELPESASKAQGFDVFFRVAPVPVQPSTDAGEDANSLVVTNRVWREP